MAQDSNAIGQPRNLREAALVEQELRVKYPQMNTKQYQKRVAKARKKKPEDQSSVGKIKQARREQKSALEEALTGDEIKRMTGR
jgi:hypothetical protein